MKYTLGQLILIAWSLPLKGTMRLISEYWMCRYEPVEDEL